MATTVAAIMTIINADTSATAAWHCRLGCGAPGTVVTLADVLAVIATAAICGVTQRQVWRIIAGFNDATLG